MGKIRITKRKTRTIRKSQQKAHIKKDKKGHNHCSVCGAFISK